MSSIRDYDHLFKLVIIGSSGVGKTSILVRFSDNIFQDEFVTTVGIDFRFKTIVLDGKTIKLQIWDTAGQERFRSITTAYYRGADGIIICYDITSLQSFSQLDNWISEIEAADSKNMVKLIVGNKADLIDERSVDSDLVQQYADEHGCKFIETSAKTSAGIDDIFSTIAIELVEKISSNIKDNNIKKSPKIVMEINHKKRRCC